MTCTGNTPNPIPKTTVGKFTNIYVVNNVFYNNLLADITSNTKNTANSGIVIKNNVFYNKDVTATFVRTFRFDLFTPFSVGYNLYYDFKTSAQSITPNSNDVQLNPLFTAPTTNDFSIASTSPAINKGTPIRLPSSSTLMFTTDFAGNARSTSNWDMGAYEFQTVLPVELVTFKGKNTQGGNLLTWATAMETNTIHFYVERSVDGKTFEKIGQVKAQGSNTSYQFLDESYKSPLRGLGAYYRLKINDLGGSSTFSKVVHIASSEKSKVKIYPSVSNGLLTIEGAKSFDIVNVFGEIVFSEKAAMQTTSCDIQRFASGFYIVRGLNTEGGTFAEKIMKQ